MHGSQAWRLESCTWLHAGLIHLLANMISLILIGVRLEQQFGFCKSPQTPDGSVCQVPSSSATWMNAVSDLTGICRRRPPAGKVGLVYLVSGFGGSVLSVLFIRKGVSVGASGALFGLLGAMLSELITNWTIYTNRVRVCPRLGHLIEL